MEKMLKVPLMMLAVTLSIFLVAGHANAVCVCYDAGGLEINCPGAPTGVSNAGNAAYACGDVVTHSCTFEADLICASDHGLIIGAENIVIDGAHHTLDGTGTPMALRKCAVNVYHEQGDPPHPPVNTRMWSVGHPCRCADVTPGDNNPITRNGCLDSGIMNAVVAGKANSGCIAGAPDCQGGCNNVKVINLVITGWCDGIFMSGQCHDKWPDESGIDPVPAEIRLTGLVIEGNHIHNNGMGGCGVYTPCPEGDGGDWEGVLSTDNGRYYNDAIFTAEIGLDSVNSPFWAQRDGIPFESFVDERTICGVLQTQYYFSWWKIAEIWWLDLVEHNKIAHNKIRDQKGCGCVACPGGSGINLQGGLEIDNVSWCGANEIAKNVIEDCAMSGVMYHHATKHNRIHGNICTGNGYGGITNACGWCNENYIFDNCAPDNYGMGIAVNSQATIANNRSVRTRAVTDPELLKLGWPDAGYGILMQAEPNQVHLVAGNTACGNAAADIVDNTGIATADDNMCKTQGNMSEYSCWDNDLFRIRCSADLNKDCKVNNLDSIIMKDQWLWGGFLKPPCCP